MIDDEMTAEECAEMSERHVSLARTALKRLVNRRIVLLLFIAAVLVATGLYWARRSTCVETGNGFRGEAKVRPDGTTLYFDGRCWTTKPLPPLDTPF